MKLWIVLEAPIKIDVMRTRKEVVVFVDAVTYTYLLYYIWINIERDAYKVTYH